MAAFTPLFEITYSYDGKTITVNDLSDYTTNDEAYTLADFIRTVVIQNASGDVVQTLEMGDELTKDFTITSDLWADTTLVLTGVDSVGDYSVNLIYPLDRIAKNMFLEELGENGCSGCGSKKNAEAMANADLFLFGMEIAAPAGEGIRWQSYANTTYSFLDSLK